MTHAPEAFATGALQARRITSDDLAFARNLFSRPEMSAHKPVPVPPTHDQISKSHAADLTHWEVNGFGRYVVTLADRHIGVCGLTLKPGIRGLNLSYHLLPQHWGKGHATLMVSALVDLVADTLEGRGPVYGLVRPAHPASARVLTKSRS